MRRRLLPLAMLAAGCLEPQLVVCADGLACPPGLLCDELHHSCASPDQLAACIGRDPGSDCMAGTVSGGCFDGVCLARGCGNRIVEPGEVCDDGNQASGDGCRGDCLSDETCGNGVLDRDEGCDDGNLISRDGCDSRCVVEQTIWTTAPIKPAALMGAGAPQFAYDEARHRLVVVLAMTWEWDGTSWTRQPATVAAEGMYFDPLRGHVVAVSSIGTGWGLLEWDGLTWTRFDTGTSPAGYPVATTFDRARGRPVIFIDHNNAAETWTLDGTLAWTKLATQPALALNVAWTAAFDPLSSQVVVIAGTVQASYDGTSWTNAPFGLVSSRISLAIDPVLGQLVAVENAGTGTYATREANGSWTARGTASPCYDAYAAGSGRALYHDGQLRLLDTTGARLCTHGTPWVEKLVDLPVAPIATLPDPRHHRLVFLSSPDPGHGAPLDMWTYDGTWQRVPGATMPPTRQATTVAYDETRGVTLLYGAGLAATPIFDTWAFDGTAWTMLDNAGPDCTSIIYDPIRRLPLCGNDGSGQMYSLDPTTNRWIADGPGAAAGNLVSMGWDPGNQHAAAIVTSFLGNNFFYDKAPDGWHVAPVAPSLPYAMVSDDRARALVLVRTDILERRGQTWLVDASLSELTGGLPGYDPADGQLAVVSGGGPGLLVYFRDRTSPTPLETCEAGVDADGDGLAGCADADCWWVCPAPCPPGTTCVP